jgi:hypothetical protein
MSVIGVSAAWFIYQELHGKNRKGTDDAEGGRQLGVCSAADHLGGWTDQ